MRIILDGAKPRYECDDGSPLPVGIAGFMVQYNQGEGVEAALVLDMVKVRAMMRPRVCLSIGGELARVKSVTLEDGRTLAAEDLLMALDEGGA